ncbi:MAG: hypothetical protein EA417_22775 [Gammaproteobacteria bacterium]|nr:MAG: hypothetical protein EA417_22775 [Gammaproteobacteria bacterium]
MIEIERIDDFRSWCIHCNGQRLIIDPWLVDDLHVGFGGRFIKRVHQHPVALRPRDLVPPDLVILTSSLPGHAHQPTLAALDRGLRVVGTPGAVAIARRLGFKRTIALGAGSKVLLDRKLALHGIRPRFPYSALNVGVLFESIADGVKIYLEPHLAPERHPLFERGVDVIITPVERVRLLGLSLSMDLEECMALARRVRARWVLATSTGAASATGWLPQRLWQVESGAEAFESVVQLHVGEGRGRTLTPGERVKIPPRQRREG